MNDSIGRRLKAARVKKGLSQAELAERIGVSQAAIGQWERGQFVPRGRNINALNEVLGPELVLAESASSTEVVVQDHPPVSLLESTIKEQTEGMPEPIVKTLRNAIAGFPDHRRNSMMFEAELEGLLRSLDPGLKSDYVLDGPKNVKCVVDHVTSRSVIMMAHPVNHMSVERLAISTLWRLVVARSILTEKRNYIAVIRLPRPEDFAALDDDMSDLNTLQRAKRLVHEAELAGLHLILSKTTAQVFKEIVAIEESQLDEL